MEASKGNSSRATNQIAYTFLPPALRFPELGKASTMPKIAELLNCGWSIPCVDCSRMEADFGAGTVQLILRGDERR